MDKSICGAGSEVRFSTPTPVQRKSCSNVSFNTALTDYVSRSLVFYVCEFFYIALVIMRHLRTVVNQNGLEKVSTPGGGVMNLTSEPSVTVIYTVTSYIWPCVSGTF